MSKKNDELNEIYDEYQKANSEGKTPDVSKKQGLTNLKAAQKAISIILVGAVLVCTGVAIKHSKKPQGPTPVTTIDTTDNTDPVSDYEYVLVEDFDVTNDDQVDQVVNDIMEIGDFDFNVKNLIYLYNEVLKRDDFSSSMTDLEIYQELQEYVLGINDIFKLGVSEYSSAINNLENGKPSGLDYDKKLITSRAILSTDSKSNSYSTTLAKNLNSLLKDVQNGVTTNFDKYSTEYYNVYMKIVKDDTLSAGEKACLINFLKAISPLYTRLTKEQRNDIDKENQALSENTLVFNLLNSLGSDFASIVANYDDGNMGRDLTPTTEKYNSSDKSDADKYAGETGEENVSEIVQTGGQQASGNSGKKEVVSEATTSRPVVSTSIVNVPDKETTTKKEQGGKPVGTTEIQTQATTIIKEEDVPPATEDVNPTAEDEVPVYTEEEWQEENKKTSVASAAGVAVLAALSAGSMGIVKKYSDKDKTKGNSKKKKKK